MECTSVCAGMSQCRPRNLSTGRSKQAAFSFYVNVLFVLCFVSGLLMDRKRSRTLFKYFVTKSPSSIVAGAKEMKKEEVEDKGKNSQYMHMGLREDRHRPISAPPVDKFFIEDDVELGDIQTDLSYSVFYRRNCKNEPRLQPPNVFLRGSCWTSQHDDLIAKAFSSMSLLCRDRNTRFSQGEGGMSLAERIDEDHPSSEKSSEYKGTSRATTPIGNSNVVDTEVFSSMLSLRGRGGMFDGIPGGSRRMPPHGEDLDKVVRGNEFLRELVELYEEQGKRGREASEVSIKELCVSVSKDQEGSRCIQKRIETISGEEVSWFFDNIVDAAAELSANLFGNYVIQKMIPLLRSEERTRLTSRLAGQVRVLSVHPYGCRVIQKLVDNSAQIEFILEEIKGSLLELIEDQNGNHVIQKCIEKCKDRRVILSQFADNSLFLATHKYGCRVIQRMLEFCSEGEIRDIVVELIENIGSLVNDQYGNYVIQHVLSIRGGGERRMVIEKIIERGYELSKYKFSSNVVEQCVKVSDHSQRMRFLSKFLEPVGCKPGLYFMCTDMYGNYVVQRLYDSSGEDIHNEIKKALRPFFKELRKSPFARHILFKLGP